jgi:hypothetical protein
MGFDDVVNQGKALYEQNKEKLDEALGSEKAEEVSDSVLDTGSEWVKKITPDEHDGKIDDVRADIDKKIGNE